MATTSTAVGRSKTNADERRTADSSRATGPDLGLIDRSHAVARRLRRQARALIALASLCVAVPLVAAAVGHAVVASDQVRSDALQTELAQALQVQQDYQLQKAELVAPTRILTIAETHLHMVTPNSILYLAPVNPGESVAQAHERAGAATATRRPPAAVDTSHRNRQGRRPPDSAP
jgi:hypothetical protein